MLVNWLLHDGINAIEVGLLNDSLSFPHAPNCMCNP